MQQDEKSLQYKKSDQPPERLCLGSGGRFGFKLFYPSVFLGGKIVEILKGHCFCIGAHHICISGIIPQGFTGMKQFFIMSGIDV